jgi:hypothetical protein
MLYRRMTTATIIDSSQFRIFPGLHLTLHHRRHHTNFAGHSKLHPLHYAWHLESGEIEMRKRAHFTIRTREAPVKVHCEMAWRRPENSRMFRHLSRKSGENSYGEWLAAARCIPPSS